MVEEVSANLEFDDSIDMFIGRNSDTSSVKRNKEKGVSATTTYIQS